MNIDNDNNGVRNVVLENSHIQLRLPSFFSNTIVWFSQIEATFELMNVRSQKTKYLHLLTNLPPDMLETVVYAMQPNADMPYEILKAAVLRDTTMTQSQAIDKLTNKLDFADAKPSKILSGIKYWFKIAKPDADINDCNITRRQFLKNLPTHIQHHLIGFTNLKLDEISRIVDLHQIGRAHV